MKDQPVNRLKVFRVLLAFVFFTPVLFLFIDFVDLIPDSISPFLHLQIVPAILSGAGLLVLVYLVLTLLFGRFYCSMICPAGILQDIFNRLSCFGKKKKNGSRRFRYHQPSNWLRYLILAATTLLAIFGFTELLLLLDPFSNFGRIAVNLFRPAMIACNNLFAGILSSHGNYTFFYVSFDMPTTALISAIVAFVVFAVLVYFRGRLFCNTLCPVGALLSLVSRYSFFSIKIDPATCNACKSCERTCKAEAIDSQNKKVDISRCIACFNCISSCPQKGINYRFAIEKATVIARAARNEAAEAIYTRLLRSATNDESASRRLFITTGATLVSTVPIMAWAQKKSAIRKCVIGKRITEKKAPVTPPGSVSLDRFVKHCTGCHLCVVQCPSHVLKPAGLEFGWSYLLKPHMSYEHSYCNYTCTVCSVVCPNHAIQPITEAQKKVTQIGLANFYRGRCIVHTEGTDCGACVEHCPMQAVHMVPYRGTLTIPKVEKELCIGCGACESICPVTPHRAIQVIANPIHLTAELPPEEEIQKINPVDFGF